MERLPSRLLSPQQKIRQSHVPSNGLHVHRDAYKLAFHGHAKTTWCDSLTNVPTIFTESGVDKLHAMFNNNNDYLIQDVGLKHNLAHGQRQSLH